MAKLLAVHEVWRCSCCAATITVMLWTRRPRGRRRRVRGVARGKALRRGWRELPGVLALRRRHPWMKVDSTRRPMHSSFLCPEHA